MPKTNVGGIPPETVLHVVPNTHQTNRTMHYLYLSSGIVVLFAPDTGEVLGASRLPTEAMVFSAVSQPEHPRT